jgi:hypothetical protein
MLNFRPLFELFLKKEKTYVESVDDWFICDVSEDNESIATLDKVQVNSDFSSLKAKLHPILLKMKEKETIEKKLKGEKKFKMRQKIKKTSLFGVSHDFKSYKR